MADSGSFARGAAYCRHGAVGTMVRRGDVIRAPVIAGDEEPCEVTVTFIGNDAVAAACSCPHTKDATWCEHIVAALLQYANEPDDLENRTSLETLTSGLERDAIQALLLNLVHRRPELARDIALEIANLLPRQEHGPTIERAETLSASPPPIGVGPSSMRRQMRSVRHTASSSAHYDSWDEEEFWAEDDSRAEEHSNHAWDLEMEILSLIEVAYASIRAGDGRAALPTLETITDDLVNDWDRVESSLSDAGRIFTDVGRAWTEAILAAALTPEERPALILQLNRWRRAGQDIGGDNGLAAAVEAARLGWDYPPLVHILQGATADKAAWEGEAPALVVARLNVLERQGRWLEAARLAKAARQDDRYMALLVRLGRTREAADSA